MELMGYREFLTETKGMPDLGETVTFEDSFDMKDAETKKKVEISSKDEFEVLEVSGMTMRLGKIHGKGGFYITKGEYDKLGGKLV